MNEGPISENVAEKEKPKRGRPCNLGTRSSRQVYRELSARSHRNKNAQGMAIRYLTLPNTKLEPWRGDCIYEDGCAWLFEGTKEEWTGDSGRWRRQTLLYEIGKFPDRESAIEAARFICERKPTARKGVALLRRMRQSLESEKDEWVGNPVRLATELEDAINHFLDRYPDTPWEVIARVLEDLHEVILMQEDDDDE